MADFSTIKATLDSSIKTPADPVITGAILNSGLDGMLDAVNEKKGDSVSLAPNWVASTAYAVGDLVTYNGALYECSTAHTSGSSWASTNWTAKSVKEKLAAQKVTVSQNTSTKGQDVKVGGTTVLTTDKQMLFDLDTIAPLTGSEKYSISGTGQSYKIAVTHAATTSGNITITIDGTATTIAVMAEDTAEEVAEAIADTTISGWSLVADGANVIMTKTSVGLNASTITFTDSGSTGVTASVSLNAVGTASALTAANTNIASSYRNKGMRLLFAGLTEQEEWEWNGTDFTTASNWKNLWEEVADLVLKMKEDEYTFLRGGRYGYLELEVRNASNCSVTTSINEATIADKYGNCNFTLELGTYKTGAYVLKCNLSNVLTDTSRSNITIIDSSNNVLGTGDISVVEQNITFSITSDDTIVRLRVYVSYLDTLTTISDIFVLDSSSSDSPHINGKKILKDEDVMNNENGVPSTDAVADAVADANIRYSTITPNKYIDTDGTEATSTIYSYYTIDVADYCKLKLSCCVDTGCFFVVFDEESEVLHVEYVGTKEINSMFDYELPTGAVSVKVNFRNTYYKYCRCYLENKQAESVTEMSSITNYNTISFVRKSGNASVTIDDGIVIDKTTTKANDTIILSLDDAELGGAYVFGAKSDVSAFASTDSYIQAIDPNNGNTIIATFTLANGVISGNFTPTSINTYIRIYSRYNELQTWTITDIKVNKSGDVSVKKIKDSLLNNVALGIHTNKYSSENNIYDGSDPTTYGGNDMMVFKKGLCIGDSLVKGTFNYNTSEGSETTMIDTTRSYPSQLSRMLGITIDNVATGGFTVKNWWDTYQNTDLSGNDFCIIHLGVNDYFKNTDRTYNNESRAAMANIINKLKNENNGIKIFVSTGFPFTTYITAISVVRPAIISQINALADDNVILLDLWSCGKVRENSAYNNVHGTAYGYFRLAQDIKNYISYYISTHKDNFKAVQFIGTDYEL